MNQVYHGSLEIVRTPEIRLPNRSLDYGSGFYATTSVEQAKKLVERSMPTLIQELKTYKLVDQYLFHTEKSLAAIKFIEVIEVKL